MAALDRSKFGEALANVMDRMERFSDRGDLDGYKLNEVIVVVAMSKPYEDADELESDAMEALVFVDGTTQIPFVQVGILEFAMETAIRPI
jgi:hypothetical protein